MGPSRRSWVSPTRRAVVVLTVVILAVAALPAPAAASPEEDLAAAQGRANRAAEELAEAQEQMARTQDAVAHMQTRVDSVETRVDAARDQVRQLAIRMYVEGTAPVVRILRMADANEVIRAQQYSHVVAGGTTDSLRQYRAEREDLRLEVTALEREQEAHSDSLENLSQRRTDAIEEIDRLGAVVARAQAARDAERDTELAAAARTRARTDPAPDPGPSASEGPTAPSGSGGITATPSPSPSPSPSEAPLDPEPTGPPAAAADWICPVQGPLAFSNDYGAPRGGGSSHHGNDILAARGTPVVASVDGVVRHRSGAISGLAYYLDGDDGTEYFGAHLDSYGESGRVSAGTVVGTVGNTGDAAGTAPHLHFEIHPGGSGNINPYPTLTQYC